MVKIVNSLDGLRLCQSFRAPAGRSLRLGELWPQVQLARVNLLVQELLGQLGAGVDFELFGDFDAVPFDRRGKRSLAARVHHAFPDRAAVAGHRVHKDHAVQVCALVLVRKQIQMVARVVRRNLAGQFEQVDVGRTHQVDLFLLQVDPELQIIVRPASHVVQRRSSRLRNRTIDSTERLLLRIDAKVRLHLTLPYLRQFLLPAGQRCRRTELDLVPLVALQRRLVLGRAVQLLLDVTGAKLQLERGLRGRVQHLLPYGGRLRHPADQHPRVPGGNFVVQAERDDDDEL